MATTIFALAIAGCSTAPAPAPEPLLRGEASTSCVQGKDWAHAVNRGAVVYEQNCDYCHKDNGQGQAGEVPRLAGNQDLLGSPEKGIRLILVTKDETTARHGMAVEDLIAIFDDLDTGDIADVMTYVRASWGNCAGRVSESEVKAIAATM